MWPVIPVRELTKIIQVFKRIGSKLFRDKQDPEIVTKESKMNQSNGKINKELQVKIKTYT